MKHGRLPWLTPGELDADQKAFYDVVANSPRASSKITPLLDGEGRFHGPFNQMLTNPSLGKALQDLGHALRFPGQLPRIVFETIVIMVSSYHRAGYEWYAHAPLALDAGISREQLDAVMAGDFDTLKTSVEPALVDLVRDTLEHRQPTDATVEAVSTAYGASGVTEAVVTVRHYETIATLMVTWAAPMPDGVPDPFEA